MWSKQCHGVQQQLALVTVILLTAVAAGCRLAAPATSPQRVRHSAGSSTAPIRTRVDDGAASSSDSESVSIDAATNRQPDETELPTPPRVSHDSEDSEDPEKSAPEPQTVLQLGQPRQDDNTPPFPRDDSQSGLAQTDRTPTETASTERFAQEDTSPTQDPAGGERNQEAGWRLFCKTVCSPLVAIRRYKSRRCLGKLFCRAPGLAGRGMAKPPPQPPFPRFLPVPTQPVFTPHYDYPLQPGLLTRESPSPPPRRFPAGGDHKPLDSSIDAIEEPLTAPGHIR